MLVSFVGRTMASSDEARLTAVQFERERERVSLGLFLGLF